jgi:hypothetical protein
MNHNNNKVDISYLQRLLDDLQIDHNNNLNSMKNIILEKDKEKIKLRKIDKQTKIISNLINTTLQLKSLLEDVKNVK